nr:EOG090X0J7Y [Lepidurus arcticus]
MDSSSPITDKYWADSPGHYDRQGSRAEKRACLLKNLNFVALANDIEEEEEYGCSKKKTVRDPMSHRIIEKRRRDRMNNCLADLSRLLPAAYLKKGRGRIEKTEIIEMAIKHMRHLQIHACQQMETCEIASNIERQNNSTDQQYRLGYSECMSEMMHFLVEVEGFFAGDALCSRLMNHLQMHGEKISRGGSGFPHAGARSSSSSSGSSSADFHRNGTSSSGSSADNSQFMPRSSTSSSNCSSKSTKHQLSELDDKETRVKVEENESSASSKSYRLPSHMAGIDSEDMDRSSQCPTNPSSTAPSENNNQDSSDSGTNMHQKDLKDMLLSDSGFTSTGTSHSSSSRLDETGFYKKYKTDIQQRFTAEEHHGQEELDEPSDLDSSKRRKVAYKASSTHESSKYDFKTPIGCADSLVPPKEPRQKSPSHFVYQNEPKAPPLDNFLTASPATHSPQCETVSSIDANNLAPSSKPDNLPVFVLHPQGSFYIPTLIEASVVTPLLTEYVQAPVLHPVTIHVSFGHSTKVIGAKMEPHSFPSSTPVADPSVGTSLFKKLLYLFTLSHLETVKCFEKYRLRTPRAGLI